MHGPDTVDTSCTPNCKYKTYVAAKGSWIIFYSPNDHVQHTWFTNAIAVPEGKIDFYKDAYKLYVHAVSESNDQFFYFCDTSMDCAGQPFYKFIVQG